MDRARGHMCAFFHSRDEQYQVLLPFYQVGFQRGNKIVHITDPYFREDHWQRLATVGIQATEEGPRAQLEVLDWTEAYLRGNRFDQHAMLALVGEVLEKSRQDGFPLTQLTANMEWALEDLPGVQDLVEYEARANYLLNHVPDSVI